MKIDFKKAICLGLISFSSCVFAEEGAREQDKDLSMSRPPEKCMSPDECRGDLFKIECKRRADDCDYDVYTKGDDVQEKEPVRKKCDHREKSDCGKCNKRKGAAKVAQE